MRENRTYGRREGRRRTVVPTPIWVEERRWSGAGEDAARSWVEERRWSGAGEDAARSWVETIGGQFDVGAAFLAGDLD